MTNDTDCIDEAVLQFAQNEIRLVVLLLLLTVATVQHAGAAPLQAVVWCSY